MSTRKTAFVIGAGASQEVGLPIGTSLVDFIIKKLDFKIIRGKFLQHEGDIDILNTLQDEAGAPNCKQQYVDAVERIRKGQLLTP